MKSILRIVFITNIITIIIKIRQIRLLQLKIHRIKIFNVNILNVNLFDFFRL